MKIKIVSGGKKLNIPMPLSMAAFAIKNIPDSVLAKFCENIPPEFAKAVCKENLTFIFNECRSELEEFSGLEIVFGEKSDGTMISIVL